MNAVKLCPNISEVFLNNLEENRKHFKPLASIDLSIIVKNYNGKIFLVYFNDDPYCVESSNYLNEYCDGEKVTFDIVDGKYKFKADFGYFLTNEDWKEWLEKGDKSYSEFLEKLKNEDINSEEFIKNLHGTPDWIQDENVPLNSKGKPMKFICQMSSYDIVNDYCGEEIYLFYDDEGKVAVQVHQAD